MTTIDYSLSVLFWSSIALVGYTYLGYPLVLSLLARLFGRYKKPPSEPVPLPSVVIVVAAHNEEGCIAQRIANVLEADYPPEQLSCLIVSDGSTDATNQIVSACSGTRVRLLACPNNRGKAAALNAALEVTQADIVVFSDANTLFAPSAVRRLVRWLTLPEVSVVSGKLTLHDVTTGRNVDSSYWKYESFLKTREGLLGAALGANGAIYAIRRSHYVAPPEGVIIDDFVIPLLIRLKYGGHIVYDPEAIAHEEAPSAISAEFWRRVRIGTGAYQSLRLIGSALHPRHGWLAFCLWSHKLLRWMVPFLLIAVFILNVALINHPFYGRLFVFQILTYGLFSVTGSVPGNDPIAKGLRLGHMFIRMNAALLFGFVRWARGHDHGTWQPTARGGLQ